MPAQDENTLEQSVPSPAPGFGSAAGFLYDIGKVSVPAEIPPRPAKLGAAELDLVKQHCPASHDVLRKVEFPGPLCSTTMRERQRHVSDAAVVGACVRLFCEQGYQLPD